MPCVLPLEGWRSAKTNENGKRPITFNIREAFVDMPIAVPCGKCVGCARDKARVWTVRNYHEMQQHNKACFITLTYADAPPELSQRDVQLFLKRLRKQIKFRYFLTGEYGEKTHRPHYHMILYGHDFQEHKNKYEIDEKLWGSKVVDRAWTNTEKNGKKTPIGIAAIGSCDIGSIAYVSGYASKKLNQPDTFNSMSTRPGIGHTWLQRYKDDIARTGFVVMDGRKFPIPRKYLEWESGYLSEVITERQRIIKNLTPEQNWKRSNSLRSRQENYQGEIDRRQEKI